MPLNLAAGPRRWPAAILLCGLAGVLVLGAAAGYDHDVLKVLVGLPLAGGIACLRRGQPRQRGH